MVAQTFTEFLKNTGFVSTELLNQYETLPPTEQKKYLDDLIENLAQSLGNTNTQIAKVPLTNVASPKSNRLNTSNQEEISFTLTGHPVLGGQDGAEPRVIIDTINGRPVSANTNLEKAILHQFELKLKNSMKMKPGSSGGNKPEEKLEQTFKITPLPTRPRMS